MRGSVTKLLRRVTMLRSKGRTLRAVKREWRKLTCRQRATVRRNYERALRVAGPGWSVGGDRPRRAEVSR